MIIYFSGTGNSLATARKIAEALNEQMMPMAEAVKLCANRAPSSSLEMAEVQPKVSKRDLSSEKCVGLVYPSYDFAPPPAVQRMLPMLNINPKAYVFVIITCGAQAGISSWYATHVFKRKGIRVAYCHKIRMPDCAGIAYGRNPNKQTWKFQKYASRMDRIIADVKARRTAYHFSGWDLLGWFSMYTKMGQKMIKPFQPTVSADLCVGCGTCARICPIGNITMQEREGQKPLAVTGPDCTACLSCVHFCPHQAMMLGGKPVDKSWQYHHPDVKLKDMILR